MRADLIEHELANFRMIYGEVLDAEEWDLSLASETSLDEAIGQIICRISDTTALIDGTKARLEELSERKSRFVARVTAYRDLIVKLLHAAEVRRRELPLATVSLREAAPKVTITDEKRIPNDLCVFKREPDRAAIKGALLHGRDVPGAALEDGQESLTIRVR